MGRGILARGWELLILSQYIFSILEENLLPGNRKLGNLLNFLGKLYRWELVILSRYIHSI